MKVTDKRNESNSIEIGEIECGEVFTDINTDEMYIKSDKVDNDDCILCVNVATGDFMWFPPINKGILLDVELIVKGVK